MAEYQAIASPRLQEVYETKLGERKNQLIVFPFLRSMGKPVIPGSSLKGALRTAILDRLITSSISDREFADTLEARTLGYMGERRPNIPNDPLKGLRVTDVSLSFDDIVAEQVDTKKKDGGRLDDLSMQILQEVTVSRLTGQDVSFPAEIRIYEGFLNWQTAPLKGGIRWLAEACNAFYRDRVLAAEERFFSGVPQVRDAHARLRSAIGAESFLIRLGWGSGMDSVSLNLRKQSPRPVKTRKLIDNRLPMGWLRIDSVRA
jgi:CRISPR type III-A-associated RAMP protein Csm5